MRKSYNFSALLFGSYTRRKREDADSFLSFLLLSLSFESNRVTRLGRFDKNKFVGNTYTSLVSRGGGGGMLSEKKQRTGSVTNFILTIYMRFLFLFLIPNTFILIYKNKNKYETDGGWRGQLRDELKYNVTRMDSV